MFRKIMAPVMAVFLALLITITCISSKELNYQKDNNKINNFFVLGDSLSDSGNLCNVINDLANNMEKVLPEGVYSDFMKVFASDTNDNDFIMSMIDNFKKFSLPKDYYKQSIFSNGPTAAQIFAKKLGIELTSGYKVDYSIDYPIPLKFNVNRKGNNYAVGGAKAIYNQQLLDMTSKFSLPLDYQNEYKHLKLQNKISQIVEDVFLGLISIKKQTDALIEHHKISSKDLFFVEIGGNDVLSLYERFQTKLYHKNVDFISLIEKETALSISNLKESLEKLVNNGAKKVMVANCVNVVDTPLINNKNEKIKNLLVSITNSFNSKWNDMFSELENKHPKIFKKVDFQFICSKFLKEFNKRNFNINDPIANYCVERFSEIIFGETKTPIMNAKSKKEQDQFFFFDLIHPSAKVHSLFAEQLHKIYETWKEV